MSQSIGGVSALALTWFPAPVNSAAASSTPGGFTTSSGSVPPASSPAATPAAGLDPAGAFQQLASDLQSLLLQLQSQDGTADSSAAATPTAADAPAQIAGTDQGDNANPQVHHHHGHHHQAAAPASTDQGSSTPADSVETAAKTFAQDFLKAIQSYTGTADNVANPATLVAAA